MPGAFHRARPAAGRHEAVGPSSTRLRHTGHHAFSGAVAHIADRFTRNRSFSARFNEVACGLDSTTPRVADSLPSDGGNCIIRDLTRRRHAASQLLMLQNPHTRRHGGRASPTRPGAMSAGATKLAQHAPHAAHSGTKLAPREPGGATCGTKLAQHAQNGLILHVLLLLGEFCPAFVANKPSRENFLPHQPRHHHGHERNNTPTQHSKPRGETFTAPAPHTNPRNETFSAPARHKQPKITHFHHAGANFLSTTGVKTKPTNSRMQFQLSRTPHQRRIRRIPTIKPHTMKRS